MPVRGPGTGIAIWKIDPPARSPDVGITEDDLKILFGLGADPFIVSQGGLADEADALALGGVRWTRQRNRINEADALALRGRQADHPVGCAVCCRINEANALALGGVKWGPGNHINEADAPALGEVCRVSISWSLYYRIDEADTLAL